MPSRWSTLPLCAFDVGRRYFVCVTAHSRIKLWDVSTGNLVQEYREPQHLAIEYTAIAYSLSSPLPSSAKKKSAAAASSPPLGWLALGSNAGAISLWNLSTGNCTYASPSSSSSSSTDSSSSSGGSGSKAHTAAVLALCFHPDSVLYSSSQDQTLHRYAFPSLQLLSSITTPSSITAIAVSPLSAADLVLTVGPALSVAAVAAGGESLQWKQRYAAVASDISSVGISNDGMLFATASSDRFVQLWDAAGGQVVEGRQKLSKGSKAVQTLTLLGQADTVAFNTHADAASSYYQLACVVDRTAVHVFSLPHAAASSSSSSSSSPAPSSVILLPQSSPSQLAVRRHQVSVQAALRAAQRNERHNHSAEGKKKRRNSATAMAASTLLETGAAATGGEEIVSIDFISDSQLLLVRGDRDRCTFTVVSYRGEGEDGAWVAELVLEPAVDGLLQAEAKRGEGQRKKRSHEVSRLPSSSAPLTASVSTVDADADSDAPTSKKQKLRKSPAGEALSPPTSSLSPSLPSLSSSLPMLQRTLAERLAEMERKAGPYAGDNRVNGRPAAAEQQQLVVPATGSLQTLLTQALHTEDAALFEYCLSSSQSTSASSLRLTLQRLPAQYALPLLTRLTVVLQSRPSRALPVLSWLQTLLLTHSAVFLSLPPSTLQSPFTRLLALLDARVAAYKKMQRLQGKLDIMLAQIAGAESRGGDRDNAEAQAVQNRARVLYVEGQGMVRQEEGEAQTSASNEEESGKEGKEGSKSRSGKRRRRRKGAAAVSPVVRPVALVAAAATSHDDEAEEEEEEEEKEEEEDRDIELFALNGEGALGDDDVDDDEEDED